MRQFYAAEATANPIWLAQRKVKMGQWETITAFPSRESAEIWLKRHPYRYGQFGVKCRVYSVPLENEELAVAVATARLKLGYKNED